MTTTKTTIKLGDTVTGTYYGVKFVGVVVEFDGYYVTYDCSATPFVLFGEERNGLALSNADRRRWGEPVLVSSGAHIAAADVGEWQGHRFLKRCG